MSQRRPTRILLAATLISTLIQLPFLFMLNLGVHSRFGGFGYLFYYPWIKVLDHFGTLAGWRWENDFLTFEAVLFVLQSMVLVSLITGLLVIWGRVAQR